MIRPNKAIGLFSELVRRHDIGIWRNYPNDERPRDLSLLLECVGRDKYISTMCMKLKHSKKFHLNKYERLIVENKKAIISEKIDIYMNNIIYKDILGYKAGIIFISYEYRNEIAQYLRDNSDRYNIDFVMLITLDKKSISIRNVNVNFNVRPIAEHYGGKGHFGAAGINLTDRQVERIISVLLSDSKKTKFI